MAGTNHFVIEKKDAIATIYFNRTEKRNAISLEMWTTLARLVREIEADRSIKVLILRGIDETAFAAGADISEFPALRYDAESAKKYNDELLRAEAVLAEISKPTIAMIQGYCVGGGCELAVACDFRFSDTTGKFGITAAKLGQVYNLPGTKYLVDLVGPAKAKDILFSGRLLSAEEALRIGLIDRLYSPRDVVAKTYEYAHLVASNAQIAVRGSKRVIREICFGETREHGEIERLILDSFDSDDYKEGVQAFLDKRKPHFKYS